MTRSGLDQENALCQLTINEWHTRSVGAAFANSVQITFQEIGTSDFEAFLDNLGRELICAVFGCVAKNMLGSSTFVGRGSMLANVLYAPIPELAMGDNINTCKNLVDARALS